MNVLKSLIVSREQILLIPVLTLSSLGKRGSRLGSGFSTDGFSRTLCGVGDEELWLHRFAIRSEWRKGLMGLFEPSMDRPSLSPREKR